MMTKAYNALSVIQMLFIDMELRPTESREIFAFYVKGRLLFIRGIYIVTIDDSWQAYGFTISQESPGSFRVHHGRQGRSWAAASLSICSVGLRRCR